jgi:hypothetical protein
MLALCAVMDGSVMLLLIWSGYYNVADHTIPIPAALCRDDVVAAVAAAAQPLATGSITVECRNPEWGDRYALRLWAQGYDRWSWVDTAGSGEYGGY